MNTTQFTPIFFLAFAILFYSCSRSFPVYKDVNNRITVTTITESSFSILKNFLQKNSEATLKDTIIIKFDFDKENCWQGLDKDSFDYLLKVLDNHQKHRQELIEERPGVSFFEFRQPGNHLSQLKRLDKKILVDKTSTLTQILFTAHTECGSSAIILPDKKVILVYTDPHFDAFYFTGEKIKTILTGK